MIEIENKKTFNETNISFNISKTKISKLLKTLDPKNLENFEFHDFLGLGCESVVHKVILKKIKATVAMKILLVKKNKQKDTIINEIKVSKKLKHKNIINYYSFIELKKDELYGIITDYSKHGNLEDIYNKLIDDYYLSESLLCFIAFQILNGLKYIHMRKICHFDIKPHNIVMDEHLNIKIIDFSISLDYSNINSNNLIQLPLRGTSFYMAPEVIKKEIINIKELNKIDLYSFGIILYNKIYKKIIKDITINNEDNFYSSYFIDFLKKLLVKDIKKRININQALDNYWVKGAQILYDEKEKIYDSTIFFDYLINDHFKNFNDYIKNN